MPAPVLDDRLSLAGRTFTEMQTAIFLWALARNHGSRRRAAATLGISRSTFCDRVRRLGLLAEGS
jgi:DNA-binding NtrC family response regulator